MSDHKNLPALAGDIGAAIVRRLRPDKLFLGHSETSIEKQKHLRGLISMRIAMLAAGLRNGWASELRIRDALCGDGEYTIEGIAIDGSPLSILMGVQDASKIKNFRNYSHLLRLKFSDARNDAIQSVETLVAQQFNHQPDFFAANSYAGLVDTEVKSATAAISEDSEWLAAERKRRYLAFIDPNGPKHFPYPQVAALLASETGRRRADIFAHISATGIKRVLSSKEAQRNISEWIGGFDAIFVHALNPKNDAWIRQPLEGDAWQWTMLIYWADPVPRGDWRKAGFVKLGSKEGKEAVEFYTKTKVMRVA